MALISGAIDDDGRDAAVADRPLPDADAEEEKDAPPTLPPATAVEGAAADACIPLPKDSRPAVNKNRGILKPSAAGGRKQRPPPASRAPPVSPASPAPSERRPPPAPRAPAGRNFLQSLGLKKMSTGSSNLAPCNQASQSESQSLALSESERNSVTEPETIEIDDGEDANQVEEEEEDGADVGSKRKLTSVVWKEFKRVKYMGTYKAKCIYCFKKLSAETRNGTKHLHDHLKSCTLKRIKMKGNKTLTQSALRFGSTDSGRISVENYTFDQDIARRELGAMIVLHEYPLSMVDHAGFRRFVSALQPLFKIGTRNTIRKDIMVQYELERKKAIDYMSEIDSRVAVTTDLWTSNNQKRGYMAITAHFIDESWNLRNIIMRFIYVPAPHTAEVIGNELYESLVEWNLDEKISTVTLDNCTTNDAVIPMLVRKIGKSKLINEGKVLNMRCCAHILNLIVKDGLEELKDAIENICESVAYWTATPKRVEKFEEIAKFVKVTINNKINLDCKTRWNSTFKMLSTALPYKAIFVRASHVDMQYTCLPSEEEWRFTADVVERLRMFHEITELFSGTNYVTANIYFTKICEIRMKIRQWSTCGNPLVEAMSANMVSKFDKYWSDIQGLMGIATVLDPRFKTLMLQICFEWLLGTTGIDCDIKVGEVTDLLSDLMSEYQLEEDEDDTQQLVPDLSSTDVLSSFSARVASKRPAAMRFKSELDRYLEDELVALNSKNFDVLDWWKVAGTQYPTLRRIAKDIFAIPVSTVA